MPYSIYACSCTVPSSNIAVQRPGCLTEMYQSDWAHSMHGAFAKCQTATTTDTCVRLNDTRLIHDSWDRGSHYSLTSSVFRMRFTFQYLSSVTQLYTYTYMYTWLPTLWKISSSHLRIQTCQAQPHSRLTSCTFQTAMLLLCSQLAPHISFSKCVITAVIE